MRSLSLALLLLALLTPPSGVAETVGAAEELHRIWQTTIRRLQARPVPLPDEQPLPRVVEEASGGPVLLAPEEVADVRLLSGVHTPRKVLMVLTSWTHDEVQQMLDILRRINTEDDLGPGDELSLYLVVEDEQELLDLDLSAPGAAATLEVDLSFPTDDLWLQDWGEFVTLRRAGSPVWQHGLLDCGRDRGLVGLPEHLSVRTEGPMVRISEGGEDGGDYGGNIELTPDGLLVLGTTTSPELRDFFARTGYGERMVLVDTDWLDVGHADEYLSFLPAANDIGYVVVRADPLLGLSLLQDLSPAERRRNLTGLVKAALDQERRFPGLVEQDGAEAWRLLQQLGVLLGRDARQDPPPASVPDRDEDQESEMLPVQSPEAILLSSGHAAARIEAATRELVEAIHAHRGDRRPVPLVSFPTLYATNDVDLIRPVFPEAVNMLVLRNHLVIPDPLVPVFRDSIRRSVEALGYTPHFLTSLTFHEGQGQVHCATNVLRDPDRVLPPVARQRSRRRSRRGWGD